MAGAGPIIMFVCFFVGCAVWTMIYLTFASHYFLTTVIDSSSGQDEIHYPSDGVIEWWWKPLFCLWVLSFWILFGAVLLVPMMAFGRNAYLISLGVLIWFMYPPSVISVLFTSNWVFFIHPVILWRMLKHYVAFVYVHIITLLSAAVCVVLLIGTFTRGFQWALPTAFVIPTALFFYGRHWGRFAWLALNFAPRKSKPARSPYVDPPESREARGVPRPLDDQIPEMVVEEVDETSEGIRAGLPSSYPHGIQAGVPASPEGIVAGAPPRPINHEEEDEWATNKKPYGIVGEEPLAAEEPLPAFAPMPSTPAPEVEEEDEWALNKKPYVFVEQTPAKPQSPANTPVTVSKYYEERQNKEKAEKARRKREAEQRFMPSPSKKTPTFATALFFGVWEFMIYPRTLRVWVNLVILTIVELFLLSMVVRFWPNVG